MLVLFQIAAAKTPVVMNLVWVEASTFWKAASEYSLPRTAKTSFVQLRYKVCVLL